MTKARPPLAAALVFLLATAGAAPARANPSMSDDFASMSFWLSHELAQGLAFNAGSNFDPPKEVKGYYLQPDVSFGAGRMPLDKREFPDLTVQALKDEGGPDLFPSSVLFPNLAVHLRMGLPWRGDAYVRFADATTPPGYKISPTMTAKVQTNSYGFGVRQHFLGWDGSEYEDEWWWPALAVGLHYNHVQGYTDLKGKFTINANGLTQNDGFHGSIRWALNSFGVDAIASHSFGAWTPFAGMGYNYATGSVGTSLILDASSVNTVVQGVGSDRPEKSQGREIFGLSYDRPTWSAFMNAELKALGQLQYRSFIVQFGAALPFDIGGPALLYKRRPTSSTANTAAPAPHHAAPSPLDDEQPRPWPQPKPKARKKAAPAPDDAAPAPGTQASPSDQPSMIFLQ